VYFKHKGMNHFKKLLIFYDNMRMEKKSVILMIREKDTENAEGQIVTYPKVMNNVASLATPQHQTIEYRLVGGANYCHIFE